MISRYCQECRHRKQYQLQSVTYNAQNPKHNFFNFTSRTHTRHSKIFVSKNKLEKNTNLKYIIIIFLTSKKKSFSKYLRKTKVLKHESNGAQDSGVHRDRAGGGQVILGTDT